MNCNKIYIFLVFWVFGILIAFPQELIVKFVVRSDFIEKSTKEVLAFFKISLL